MKVVYKGPSPARFVPGLGRFEREVPVELEDERRAALLCEHPHFEEAKGKGKAKAKGKGD